ncbi:MAG: cobaltochelatase subunit CobN [Candidatus Methanomethylophilaceae archaeon]|nr:cobaltochelatase subunit CobN [Candidatus Methanomethylophilaceae archaeon]
MSQDKPVITAFVWDSYSAKLKEAGDALGMDVRTFTRVMLYDRPENLKKLEKSMRESDLVIIHLMGANLIPELESLVRDLPKEVKVLSMGRDPMSFIHTTGPRELALGCCRYLQISGKDNCDGCLRYLLKNMFGRDIEVPEPKVLPYHGIIHPTGGRFGSIEEYISWYKPKHERWIGIITSRSGWANDNYDVETDLFERFERRGFNVVMVYADARTIPEEDMLGLADATQKYMVYQGRFLPEALVKTTVLQFGQLVDFGVGHKVSYLEEIDVPVFQPVVPSAMSRETFETSPGLKRDVSYAVTFQEFEGTIEPMLLGFSRQTNDDEAHRRPIPERADHLVERVIRRVQLRYKPNSEKKVAIILNNFPCAGAEANIGEAHNLNVMDSLANILRAMADDGYSVEVPDEGKDIIGRILERKAMSDFRWTDAAEIERCGGVLHHMTVSEYNEWFSTLSDKVRADVIKTWGDPPGESMVKDGEILITGVTFGNVLIMVQPKRGCYGPKCDGTVCRILHDPVCPPTHQYLASYHWLDSTWDADVIVHTGTHGNLEYLPGKGVGLTADCYPDICIGTMPHVYIFDASAVPAATLAKRRSYATLIDHMPPVTERVKPYGPAEKLGSLLEQYSSAKDDQLRSEVFRGMLVEAGIEAGMDPKELDDRHSLQTVVKRCTEEYSRLTSTKIPIGLHVIGDPIDTHHKATVVMTMLSYGEDSIIRRLARSRGIDPSILDEDPDAVDPASGKASTVIYGELYDGSLALIEDVLNGKASELGKEADEQILRLAASVEASDELGAFIHALDGGYTPAGPAGLISRGRTEVLPTGRNPYTLDPRSVPTKTSWTTGMFLANETIRKYREDTGEEPETVSIFWTSSDLMNEGGEMMSQMMYLIGTRPIWNEDGRVESFEIIPLEELGRPRIDVTVRMSGILRDMFADCMDMLDSAITAVSALDEPEDQNHIRAHTMKSILDGIPEDDATARLFSSAPGAATSGVPLAIYANAWHTERDLADIYVATNGYAYGGNRDGKPLHKQFMNALASSSLTYSKIGNDEHDFLGTPGFFGNIGGMAVASKILTGRDIKNYVGDTRGSGKAGVRTLQEEMRRSVRSRLLNPQWIEGMKKSGYQGAAEIMKRAGRVHGFGATTDAIDDRTFDDIAETFINDKEMREFFKENNPYAAEEIARRLLEAAERGFWKPDPQVLEKLKDNYLMLEGDLEGIAGDGEYQGSSTEIATYYDVDAWKQSNGDVMDSVRKLMDTKTAKE